ncbi:hypothetical protein DFH11DRAFT_417667 [Phellopilus nigrolimitatus]|nr:hypothetical protein DFH11DRAFT_417667 [Phellopilus nigrolimitatus]
MVSFQCDACQDVVKKPKLDAHSYRCYASFTCVDCSTTFNSPREWKGHTQCITEAEKYQKGLYKGKKAHQDGASGPRGEHTRSAKPTHQSTASNANPAQEPMPAKNDPQASSLREKDGHGTVKVATANADMEKNAEPVDKEKRKKDNESKKRKRKLEAAVTSTASAEPTSAGAEVELVEEEEKKKKKKKKRKDEAVENAGADRKTKIKSSESASNVSTEVHSAISDSQAPKAKKEKKDKKDNKNETDKEQSGKVNAPTALDSMKELSSAEEQNNGPVEKKHRMKPEKEGGKSNTVESVSDDLDGDQRKKSKKNRRRKEDGQTNGDASETAVPVESVNDIGTKASTLKRKRKRSEKDEPDGSLDDVMRKGKKGEKAKKKKAEICAS